MLQCSEFFLLWEWLQNIVIQLWYDMKTVFFLLIWFENKISHSFNYITRTLRYMNLYSHSSTWLPFLLKQLLTPTRTCCLVLSPSNSDQWQTRKKIQMTMLRNSLHLHYPQETSKLCVYYIALHFYNLYH